MTGHVALVSAGPGDPDLLTVKALRLIGAADAILYDDLSAGAILAHARPDARLIDVGKRAGRPSCKQDVICAMLVELAAGGAQVVRLKSGDAAIFGRLEEELLGRMVLRRMVLAALVAQLQMVALLVLLA